MNELKNKEEAARFHEEQEKKAAKGNRRGGQRQGAETHGKAGQGGRLFGSVTAKEVAEELAAQFGVKLDKRKIQMADVKAFGTYEAEIKLGYGFTAKVSVMVTE